MTTPPPASVLAGASLCRVVVESSSVHEVVHALDFLDDLTDLEWLLEKAVESLSSELHGLSIGELAAHGDDAGHGEVFGVADGAGDASGLVVPDVEVEEDDVRAEALALEPGGEGGGGDDDFVSGLLDEDLGEDVADVLLIVGDEDAGATRMDPVHGDVVVPHELEEVVDGDAAVLGARNAVALELAGIEPL